MAHDPSENTPVTYADAGVNIDRANKTKKRIRYLAHKTFTRNVVSEIGGFGGLYAARALKRPVRTGANCSTPPIIGGSL